VLGGVSKQMEKVLTIIPARSGSKRLPGKNKMSLCGKPLISWSIEAAIQSEVCTEIVVTSDDLDILELVKKYKNDGVHGVLRRSGLAQDHTSITDVLIDVITQNATALEYNSIILLQPTSPLRTSEDIDDAYELFARKSTDCSVTSVTICEHPVEWTARLGNDNVLEGFETPVKRSQDYEKSARLNGAIYIASMEHLLKEKNLFTQTIMYHLMPNERSVDIDTYFDFKLCEFILEGRLVNRGNM